MAAKAANAANAALSMFEPSGKEKYELLESVNIEENVKNIGDEIVKTFAEEQMGDIDNISRDDLKKQIRKDLVYIYYQHRENDNAVVFSPKTVRDDIQNLILDSWYAALELRKDIIITDLIFLLENNDKIISKPSAEKGGGLFSALSRGISKDSRIQKDLLGKIDPGDANNSKTQDDADADGDAGDGDADADADADADGADGDRLSNDNKPKNIRGDEFYFEELIKYKKKLISYNKNYSSGYQAVKLHQNILKKVIKHYSTIPREYLSTTLRRIILGDDAIGYLNEYKTEEKYTSNPDKLLGIYDSFIEQITTLSNGIIKLDLNPPPSYDESKTLPNTNGGEKIPNYMPTSYNWNKIKSVVRQKYKTLIKDKLEKYNGDIKEAFKDVFRVVNCNALRFDLDNNTMKLHLETDFNKILELLCEKMPDNYSVNILQNYIKNNTEGFKTFLNDTVYISSNNLDSVKNYQNFVNAFLNNPLLIPMFPTFDSDKIDERDNVIKSYVAKLEKCCDRKITDKDISPVSSVPKIIQGNDTAIHLTLSKVLPMIYESLIKPSSEKQYIESPVFEVFKEQFMQCSDDVDLLAELFNMYSSRSIQFIQKIQGQFFVENSEMNEYIVKFILTKHPYTKKIISECIEHAAKIRWSLSKKDPIPEKLDDKISKYATFLILTISKTSLKNDIIPNEPADENYIRYLIDTDNLVSEINNLIGTDKNIRKEYNSELKKLFALNDTIQPPPVIEDADQNDTTQPLTNNEPESDTNNVNETEPESGVTNNADVLQTPIQNRI